jgi:hypothetical protein
MMRRYYCTLSALLLGLFGRAVSSSHRVIPVAIIHGQHEGSHALISSFSEIECVASIGEYLDDRNFESPADQGRAIKIFFDPAGPDAHELHSLFLIGKKKDEVEKYSISKLVNHCKSLGLPVVIAALIRGRTQYILNFSRPLFFLYRGDRMRFSLSLASSVLDEIKDPQFKKGFIAPKRNYSIKLVEQKSDVVTHSWKERAKEVQNVIDRGFSCSRLILLGYEEFQKNNSLFTTHIYKMVLKLEGISVPLVKRASSSILPLKVFTKVHSDNISEFVENSEEVERYFKEDKGKSFEEVIDSNVKECTFEQMNLNLNTLKIR